MRQLLLLTVILLTACGPSLEEKQNIAAVTCSIMGETRNMDAAVRVREINDAREKIGGEPFLGGDDAIQESIKWGLCKELVLNDSEYVNKLKQKEDIERKKSEEIERKKSKEIDRKHKEHMKRKARESAPKIVIIGGDNMKRSGMPILINNKVTILDLAVGDDSLFSYFNNNLRLRYECEKVQDSQCELYKTKWGKSVSLENRGSIKIKVDSIEPGFDENGMRYVNLKINSESVTALYDSTRSMLGRRVGIIFEQSVDEQLPRFSREEIVIVFAVLQGPLSNTIRIPGYLNGVGSEKIDSLQVWGETIVIETGLKAPIQQVNKVIDWIKNDFDVVIREELTDEEAIKKRDFILDIIN